MRSKLSLSSGFLSAILLISRLAHGQSDLDPDQIDPEDRQHGVARISLLNGDVSVRRGDSGDYVAASMNAPLLVQDSVSTGPASRAEVQFDFANRLRIAHDADVRLGDLRADRYQVQVARGAITFSVLRDSDAQVEISTPSIAIHPLRRGEYRVEVSENGVTQITVRSGEAEVASQQGTERLPPGRTMMVRGEGNSTEFQVVAAYAPDEWDIFNERRDQELERSTSYRYVSRDIVGAEDLDAYGQWVSDPTYGNVWAPRVAADWAPYQAGRWVWGDYYGWTWVSSDPWGWGPYHYGSWFRGSAGWCWYPGPVYSRHWFRPALVSFFGFGRGGLGVGFGQIGWVPLAPHERFHPWWGRGGYGGYGNFGRNPTNFNIVQNTNVFNIYRNARVDRGVTAVNGQDFIGGRFRGAFSPGANQLREASLVRGALPIAPTAGNLRFSDRPVSGVRNSGQQTRFYSRGGGSPVGRTPFAQQQQSLAQATQNYSRQSGAIAQSAPQRSDSNWGRDESSRQSQRGFSGSGSTSGRSQEGSGWSRFGSPNSAPVQGRSNFYSSQQGGAPSRPSESPAAPAWSSFGNPRNGSPANGGQNYPRSRQQYSPPSYSTPSNSGDGGGQSYGRFQNQSQQRGYQPNNYSGGGSRSLQIAPPIVHERSQQNYGNRPSYSAPQQQNYRPSYPAPQQNYSPRYSAPSGSRSGSMPTPNYRGGGGGSSSRSSGAGSQHDSGSGRNGNHR